MSKAVCNCCLKCDKSLFYYTILTKLALPVVGDIDFIVITGNILRSVDDIPFCPIHFTITFSGQMIVHRYTGNIVLPKIVKPGFRCMWACW